MPFVMLLASNGLRPGPRVLLLFLAVVCLMAFYYLCKRNLRTSLFLEKCRFKDKTLWIIAEIGVFLVWKNAGPYVGTKNIALH